MPFVRTDTIKPGLNEILIKNISETDLKLFIQLTKINDNTFKYLPETEEIFPNLLLTSKTIQACISRPFFNCEGATDTSGCIDIKGLWDLEIDGVRILSDVTPQQIESYLINESPHITNHPSCCFEGYYRSVSLPYPIQEGSTVYIPIALTPDGESITTPMVAQGPDPYNNIGEQLAIQLEPHGLYARNSMYSHAHDTSFGITYYDATSYNNTFFYILDEGNTFSEEQMPRGLPPYRCFFIS